MATTAVKVATIKVHKGQITGGTWTSSGKRLRAQIFLDKGKSFLGAALLLRQKGGNESVVLHLLCQGAEIVLKAMLLLKDFNKYSKKVRGYGHDIAKVHSKVIAEFKLKPLRPELAADLAYLNALYKKHLLRYDSYRDILIDPKTIPSGRVFRWSWAMLKLIDRKLAKNQL